MAFWFYVYISSFLSIIFKYYALFNPNAKESVSVRNNQLNQLSIWKKSLPPDANFVQIHCASLGEFEMGKCVGRRLIAVLKNTYVIYSFFSPSGYNHCQLNENEFKCYLPYEQNGAIHSFLKVVNPYLVIFIKYEFWFKYLFHLKANQIPYGFVNLQFQKQPFLFRFSSLRSMVEKSHFLGYNNSKTLELMNADNSSNSFIHKDIRYIHSSSQAEMTPTYSKTKLTFLENKPLIIFGSIWPEDEHIFMPFIQNNKDFYYLVAPHKVDKTYIQNIAKKLKTNNLWSNKDGFSDTNNICIVDTIGDLKYLYRHADLAYIGGGFSEGLHNFAEASIYNIPVFFGPKIENDIAAIKLVESKSAYTVKTKKEFDKLAHTFLEKRQKIDDTDLSEIFTKELHKICSHILETIQT